jgi:DNA-binding beta-propeller fold protein YncE
MRTRVALLLVVLSVVAVACTSQDAERGASDDGATAAAVTDAGDTGAEVSDANATPGPETSEATGDGQEGDRSYAGTIAAPEFPPDLDWINTDSPLALSQLRGKVVVLDFWTYGCINCIHIIPDLERLEEEYAEELVVIGVHSAKFDNERATENIREVVVRYDLEHPVVNDGDFEVWRAFGVQAWPTVFVIDPAGNVSGYHAGEGVYDLLDPVIASLVTEFDAQIDRTPLDLRLERDVRPATILSYPGKVEVVGGELFVADTNRHRIVRATQDGDVVAVYGGGVEGFVDGDAAAARFHEPQGMAVDASGDTLYVADTGNHAIRAIDLISGEVTTVAGTGEQGRWPPTGGDAAATPLHSPWDLEASGSLLYIAMAGTHQIWEFDLERATVAPLVGSGAEGTDNATLATSSLAQPSGLALAADGRLYFADSESSSIRWADVTGGDGVGTLAGTDNGLFEFGDVDGTGTEARLQHPLGVVIDGPTAWIADTYNSKIKRIDLSTGVVETFAGSAAGWRDGADPLFYEPGGLDLADGRLYVADTNNHAIRVLDTATGETTTVVLKGIETFLPDADDDNYQGLLLELEPVDVAPGPTRVVLDVALPEGYKPNPDAPSSFEWHTEPGGIDVDGDGVIVDPVFPLSFDARVEPGASMLVGDLSIIYCDVEAQSICLFEQVRVRVPLRVGEGGGNEIAVRHEIVLPDL